MDLRNARFIAIIDDKKFDLVPSKITETERYAQFHGQYDEDGRIAFQVYINKQKFSKDLTLEEK